ACAYELLRDAMTPEQRALLVRNRFVARPTPDEQLFYLYENNTYHKIPSFVTTDSVLHSYHIFYDFTLRYLEQERLFAAVTALSRRMLEANLAALGEGHTPEVRVALMRNAAFFAVPLRLMGVNEPELPAQVAQMVQGELARIAAHADWTNSAITGARVNYTQFLPRGHYTRTEAFKRYFKAMMWYGLVPLNIEFDPKNNRPTLQALLIVEQLTLDSKALELWQQLYDPTVFYVGKADDLSYDQLAPLIARIFGAGNIDRFDDGAKLTAFRDAVKTELPKPGVQLYDFFEGGRQGRQFRFMGQRFIPDSRIMQELTWDKVGTEEHKRYFPLGLDVFAVLGNPRAAQLLDVVYKQPAFENYLAQRKMLMDEIAALSPADWQQNLYYGWMYCLLPLQTPRPEGYPAFMRGLAWQDKSLVTSLGSWTELRHDTLLYAKQSSVSECGGEFEEPPPPTPGYVEPEVEVYERLSWLLKLNKAGLLQRKLATEGDELAMNFDKFIGLVDFLAAVSRKELRNQPLAKDDLYALERYGGTLEWLMLAMNNLVAERPSDSWWDIESKTDRSMALVADVHTANFTVLEEAVGNAAEIWVVVPFAGKLILTRGATFTYYEFEYPATDRLTDEAWQEKLRAGTAPPMPYWTRTFLLPPGPTTPSEEDGMSTGEESGC
ncbi:MAG TPA: DUF3160 domain-containing protein, partial [Armatimonadota bacterium]|nr:DUF3160 domain-containing protein [Armatimonadota bacterium]